MKKIFLNLILKIIFNKKVSVATLIILFKNNHEINEKNKRLVVIFNNTHPKFM